MKSRIKNMIHQLILMTKEEKLYPVPTPVNTTELLKNKVALIIGGSGGIGKAIAKAFLYNGAKVIIAGSREDRLRETLEDLGENAFYIVIDMKEVALFASLIKEAAEIYGRIDILVNSAGINAKHSFFDMTEEEYNQIMDINAKGTFFMCQAVGRYMIENHIKGHILNISSSSALRPASNPYRMSKWAIRGLTLGVADELLPYGIIVNAIAPGPVATSMLDRKEGDSIYKEGQPSGRYALPSEIANMAVMLVSDMGNLVVGDTVYMTGGSGNLSYHE